MLMFFFIDLINIKKHRVNELFIIKTDAKIYTIKPFLLFLIMLKSIASLIL